MTESQTETALRLLKEKATLLYISQVTGLTIEEIKKLQYSQS
jgi:hypothetical protein